MIMKRNLSSPTFLPAWVDDDIFSFLCWLVTSTKNSWKVSHPIVWPTGTDYIGINPQFLSSKIKNWLCGRPGFHPAIFIIQKGENQIFKFFESSKECCQTDPLKRCGKVENWVWSVGDKNCNDMGDESRPIRESNQRESGSWRGQLMSLNSCPWS